MTSSLELKAQLARVAGLAEEQRRNLYAHVAGQALAVSRDEAARAIGISRPLAAYHLDRLVRDGLLETRFERRSGRSGPGAGRPAKLYFRSRRPVELSVPARNYAFLAELLADAVEGDNSGTARASLQQAARDAGRGSIASAAPADGAAETEGQNVREALAARGYEPYDSDDGGIRLRNCPFDRLAEAHRELVCSANLAFVEGVADRLRLGKHLRPRLDPRPGECCVAFAPEGGEASGGE